MSIASVNPRTGAARQTDIHDTSVAEVSQLATRAATAAREFRQTRRAQEAPFLQAAADRLEDDKEELAQVAESETALGMPRLTGEVQRTVFQLRAFADVVEEGSYQEVMIDSAQDTAMGPQPELRRSLIPVGPVA